MKYICLGHMDETAWETMPETERLSMMDECFAYDEELIKSGHFVGGEALQGPRTATTLRYQNGRVAITDGPFSETKEQLGGILMLEATDLNHAIQIMSKHPSVRFGTVWEIRPAAELKDLLAKSQNRRGADPIAIP